MEVTDFRENKNSAFSIALRIAIQGAEVTSYLTEDPIEIHYGDRDGPNTVMFTLHNAYDTFVLTKENLAWDDATQTAGANGKWRGTLNSGAVGSNGEFYNFGSVGKHYSEAPKRLIYEYKKGRNLRTTKSTNARRAAGTSTDAPTKKTDDINTYDFRPGTVIFNKNDPVRIFMHNPMKEYLGGVDKGEWVPVFTGFIDSKPVQTNYLNGSSSITIKCSCLKAQLEQIRTCFTPIVQYSEAMIQGLNYNEEADFYRDLLWQDNQGIYQHPFTHRSFHDSISLLFLGDPSKEPGKQGSRSRIGFMSRGQTYRGSIPSKLTKIIYTGTYDVIPESIQDLKDVKGEVVKDAFGNPVKQKEYKPNSKEDVGEPGTYTFEKWYKMLLFGDRASYPSLPAGDVGAYTTDEVTTILSRTVTFDPEFSPWAAKLHMLLPPSGTELNELFNESIKTVRETREWGVSRAKAIRDLVSLIDFQWITTPMGDMAIEYPMYDFTPYDYGTWAPCFIVEKFAQDDTIDEEGGEMISALIANAGIDTLIGASAENAQPVEGYFNRVVIKSDVLAGKYGSRTEVWEAPVGKQAKKGVTMPTLVILALVEFQKRLAQFDKATLNFAFHPFLLPNRNLMWGPARLGDGGTSYSVYKQGKLVWINSVDYSIKLFQEVTVNVEVNYVRNYSIKPTENQGIDLDYRYIFGGAMMPINFKNIDDFPLIKDTLLRSGGQGLHVLWETPDQTKVTQESEAKEKYFNSLQKDKGVQKDKGIDTGMDVLMP